MVAALRDWPASRSSPTPPFAHGIAAERFDRHYATVRQDWKLQLAQRLYNFWHFYFVPYSLGTVPVSFLADRLFGSPVDGNYWVLLVAGVALFVMPAAMVYRRKRHAHKRFQVFYRAALERCIADEAGRGA